MRKVQKELGGNYRDEVSIFKGQIWDLKKKTIDMVCVNFWENIISWKSLKEIQQYF